MYSIIILQNAAGEAQAVDGTDSRRITALKSAGYTKEMATGVSEEPADKVNAAMSRRDRRLLDDALGRIDLAIDSLVGRR